MLLNTQSRICAQLPAQHSVQAPHGLARQKASLQFSVGRQQQRHTGITRHAVLQTKAAAAQDFDLGPSLGPDNWNKTYYPRKHDTVAVHKPWFLIDAEGQTLGRLAVLAATVLRGKDQPGYTPSMDMGAYVIVINAEKVTVTGKKYFQKLYRSHPTAQPGTLKTETFRDLQKRIPERIVEKAVFGMLPKGRLGNKLHTHLKVFKGTQHPHTAQQAVDITSRINQKFNGTMTIP